ncbi:hypothetical protein C5167_024829 [Papaver somniferum]|uniref:Uncharacterized protein n=1 Tax=Papaver somniferum TaxID=3469 RepID=A0A4Y7JTI5_PAPSO|nr:hypothetical protein C5167_024829 [Papaver somniferum]
MLNFPGVLVSRASADIISHEGALQEIELGTAEVETDKNLLFLSKCSRSRVKLAAGSILDLSTVSLSQYIMDEEIEADRANYQLQMMRCLREVNADNNTAGWDARKVDIFLFFQRYHLACWEIFNPNGVPGPVNGAAEGKSSVLLALYEFIVFIHDIARYNQGVLALKAMELADSFVKRLCSLTLTGLQFMERNIEDLIECMDGLSVEQQKGNLSRQQAPQQAWLQKRSKTSQTNKGMDMRGSRVAGNLMKEHCKKNIDLGTAELV